MDDPADPAPRGKEQGPAGWRPTAIEHHPDFASLIADPGAGRGRVGRELPLIQEALRRQGFGHRTASIEGPGDGARLAREALDRGERFVVAVGDDRIVNDVANGLIAHDRPVDPEAVLGILAASSGCDVVRTFGLSQDPEEAVARFSIGNVYPIDVGKATTRGPEGEVVRYFVNMAHVGMSASAAARAARLPRALGRSRYLLGFWLSMAGYRRPRVRLEGDRRGFDGRITNLVIANLQYSGDGMLVSPRSWPEDGYLDLQVFTGPKSDSFTMLPKMFRGEHLPHPNVLELRSKRVAVEADRPLWVEADGEPMGRTPAVFEAVPGVLRLKV